MLRTYTIEIVADIPDGKELRVDIDLKDRDDQIATERGFSFVSPVIGMSRRTLKYGFEYLGVVDMVDWWTLLHKERTRQGLAPQITNKTE